MRYRKPEEFKESKVEWHPKIPEGWDEVKVAYLFRLGRGRVISQQEIMDNKGEYPVYSSQTGEDGVLGYIDTYDFEGDYITWTTDGAHAGTVFRRSGKFNCTNVCGTLDPTSKEEVLDYLHYAISVETKRFVRHDINPKLMNNQMASIRIVYPPKKEQRSIAAFLDRKTEAIDGLIQKKEQLIERLKEKRQALITKAVTKGLDPNVPMKDSDIEWLGEIPEHWEVTKVKLVADRVTTGKTPSTNNSEYYNGARIDWFGPGDFNENYLLQDADRKITEYAVKDLSLDLYKPLSVLLVGIGATVGKIGITEEIAYSNQQINAIEFKEDEVNPWFGLYQLDSIKDYIVSLASSSTLPIFNQTDTKNLFFLNPPKSEQDKIVSEIKEMSNRVYKTIDLIEDEIKKLKEYRQSLISTAVTGKIDVRDEVEVESKEVMA